MDKRSGVPGGWEVLAYVYAQGRPKTKLVKGKGVKMVDMGSKPLMKPPASHIAWRRLSDWTKAMLKCAFRRGGGLSEETDKYNVTLASDGHTIRMANTHPNMTFAGREGAQT